MRVSCWIKFVGSVPRPAGSFGFKLHGAVDNTWVRSCNADEWTWICSVAPATGGDNSYITLIFDDIDHPQTIRFTALELEVFSERPALKPSPTGSTTASDKNPNCAATAEGL